MSRWLDRLGLGRSDTAGRGLAKSFREEQKKEKAYEYRKRGRFSVPLERIVGSVGRYHDFDNRFQPRQGLPTERLERIRKAMRQGRDFPPVDLYQIKDDFYVSDGHHRVTAAMQLGRKEITAEVIEFLSDRGTLQDLLYRERGEFSTLTGLPPTLTLTEPGQYELLLKQIRSHQAFLQGERHEVIPLEEAASDWHATIYLPLVHIIEKGELLDAFPNRTLADLYAYISCHHWEQQRTREYGIGIEQQVPLDMEAFRKKMADIKESRYPDMRRAITAFVLINVKVSRDHRIMDKLFAFPEVSEIYSVYGDVDILVKINLTRDLITSDAEIIGEFVHEKLRKIQGVLSTRTLIPSSSRIKTPKT